MRASICDAGPRARASCSPGHRAPCAGGGCTPDCGTGASARGCAAAGVRPSLALWPPRVAAVQVTLAVAWAPPDQARRRPGRPCPHPRRPRAATEQPIAAPAWPSCGTRPPLRNLCVLRTVRAAGSGFRGRHRALCAGRGISGRLFGLRGAARPRTWRYVIVHGIRDKVHITNSWQSSRTCPMCSIVAQCIW